MYIGQAPGSDFSNPIGPLVYGLAAVGMQLQQSTSLDAVSYGNLIFLAILVPVAWHVSRWRLPSACAAGFIVYVALLTVALRPLGYSPWTTTYAMLYNRDGWLLYSTLLVLVLLRPARSSGKRTAAMDGLALGLLLGLMFYCKLTFFMAGLMAVAVGLALSTLAWSALLGLCTALGLAVVALAMRVLFAVDPIAYAGDFLNTASVQSKANRLDLFVQAVMYAAPVTFIAVLLALVLHVSSRRGIGSARPLRAFILAGSFILASSLLLTTGNAAEGADLPALVVLPLLAVNLLWIRSAAEELAPPARLLFADRRWTALFLLLLAGAIAGIAVLADVQGIARSMLVQCVAVFPLVALWPVLSGASGSGATIATRGHGGSQSDPGRYLHGLLLVLIMATSLPIVAKDAISLANGVADRGDAASAPASQQFASAALEDFLIPADSDWQTAYRSARDVPTMINDGTDLLRSEVPSAEPVFTVAYTDPFPLALGRPPSQCGPLWWDLNFNFDSRTHPTEECVLGSAQWVMVPRMRSGEGCCQETVDVMLDLYSAYLSQHFAETARTEHWILHRRVS